MDRRLRELERQAQTENSPQAQAQLLREYLRRGTTTTAKVQARAYFGDPAAELVLPTPITQLSSDIEDQDELFIILSRWLALVLRYELHNEIVNFDGGGAPVRYTRSHDFWDNLLAAYQAFGTLLRLIQDSIEVAIAEGVEVRTRLIQGSSGIMPFQEPQIHRTFSAVVLRALQQACQAALESGLSIHCLPSYSNYELDGEINIISPSSTAVDTPIRFQPAENGYTGPTRILSGSRTPGAILIALYLHARMHHPEPFFKEAVLLYLANYGEDLQNCCRDEANYHASEAIAGLTQAAMPFRRELTGWSGKVMPAHAKAMIDWLSDKHDWIDDQLKIIEQVMNINTEIYQHNLHEEGMRQIAEIIYRHEADS